ncbi:MAG: oligopeptide transport system ATP-binding protein [Gammaproteobacteria bacterium]|nr:oligopeptide transport system ATP-binding protein [Gammaproteobacteria bacterium]
MTPTLAIDDLSVAFASQNGPIAAVREVSLAVRPAECVGIVGESGSGKTQVFMAAMGLLPRGVRVAGSVRFEGREMLSASPRELNAARGSRLTMIFQDPMTSLTPHLKIGVQLAEVLVTHSGMAWRDAGRAALDILERVRVPEAKRRLGQYPHELSGGMRQRVMIGMSLLCAPALLIADEPTTALDVTVQAQIIDLLRVMREELHMAIVLVSHDLGVVAGLADRILVMYAGRIVESGAARDVLEHVGHPYTAALLQCVPTLLGPRLERMHSIEGLTPSPLDPDVGCAFAPRCPRAAQRCRVERPLLSEAPPAHQIACHFPLSP